MPERILVAVAWPYANGSIHIGHVAGTYLPADIFARYHRIKGNEALMVSGSDAHGTPVTLTAEQQGVTPEAIFRKYQAEFLDSWQRLGISFDLFTTTHTDNHADVRKTSFSSCLNAISSTKTRWCSPSAKTSGAFLPTAMWRDAARTAPLRKRAAISAITAAGRSIPKT